jgi:hypothetical protein
MTCTFLFTGQLPAPHADDPARPQGDQGDRDAGALQGTSNTFHELYTTDHKKNAIQGRI